jgi:hypothetical protein
MTMTILLTLALWGPPPAQYPLFFHVAPAASGKGAVVDDAWLDTQVRQASAVFTSIRLDFRRAGQGALPAENARLNTRTDRNALGRFLKPNVINVFVVQHLRDIHDPSRFRQGVHWRPYGRKKGPKGWVRHLVIVSAQAGPTVLAHELGHFFGHPKHSKVPGNLMSYLGRDKPPVLSAGQGRRMRQWARRFVRQGELPKPKAPSTALP